MSTPARGLSVSVVLPAYKAARTVGRALDSVFAQTRADDEVVVIDDGSPDDLAGALRPYADRVRLVRQDNGGAASARNRGIDCTSGDFVAFLDADDVWEPAKIQRQLDIFARHPELGLVAARFWSQPPGKPPFPPSARALPWCDRVLESLGPDALTVATCITTSTVMLRRSALGEQRFDTALGTAEDVDLWVRLVLGGPVYLLSETLVTLVLEAGSLSRKDPAADFTNMLRVLRRHAALLGPRRLRGWEAHVYRDWAASHLGNGEGTAAVWPAWNRLLCQPGSPQAWWILAKALAWACRDGLRGLRPRPADAVHVG
jgi:glycosyltransferase involved in cell wall biosynthesis